MVDLELFVRQNKIDLSRYLPRFLYKDETFKATSDICSDQHELIRLKLIEILKQKYVRYAVDGLEDWEHEFDLPVGDSITDRRKRILLYLQSNTISSKVFLEKLVSSYCAAPAYIVEHNSKNSFEVMVRRDSCFNMEAMKKDVELYKPAHLGWEINEILELNQDVKFFGKVLLTEEMTIEQQSDYKIEAPTATLGFAGGVFLSEEFIVKG